MPMIILCSWHKEEPGVFRQYPDEPWRPLTKKVITLIEQGEMVSHGICSDCAKRVRNQLSQEERQDAFLGDK